MLRITENDSSFHKGSLPVYQQKIETDEDILFECSFFVADSIFSSGKIIARHDLFLSGDIKAKNIDVNSNLICFGNVETENLFVQEDAIILGDIKCVNSLNIGCSIYANDLYFKEGVSKGIFVKNICEIASTAKISEYIISLCGIQGQGSINTKNIIAFEYIDNENCDYKYRSVLSENENNYSFNIKDKSGTLDNSEKIDILNLFDSDSYVCKTLNNAYEIFEIFEIQLVERLHNSKINEVQNWICVLAEYSEQYELYHRSLSKILSFESKKTQDLNFHLFFDFLEALNDLPEWMRMNPAIAETSRQLKNKFLDVINISPCLFRGYSITEWAHYVNLLNSPASSLIDKKSKNTIMEILFKKIGLRFHTVEMMLEK